MNPHKVLQVDPSAEPEVIEAAYKQLAAKYHPDKNPSASATARMQEINAAYDILKDPARRAEYERNRPATATRFDPISNSVVKALLGVGALIGLLVYRPWLAALAAVVWGAVRLFEKYPGPIGKLVKLTLVAVVAVVLGFVWSDWQRDRRAKKELATVDLATMLARRLDGFTRECAAKANKERPELAGPYCSCVARVIRGRFDMSPIHVDSLHDYQAVVTARFAAATPDDGAQTACPR